MKPVVAKIQSANHSLYITILGATIIALLGLYMYFVSMSVVHVVLRKEVIQSQKEIQSDIAQLESSYITAQHKVSDKIAATEQFSETSEKIFVSRAVPALVLNSRN